MTNDVFISYAHEDVAVARKLAAALVALRGWSVWWDTSLRTGEQYPKRIEEAIGDTRCVVVLWSKFSIDSNWVVAETSEGWNRGILAPVQLDDAIPPMPFRQTQSRSLVEWKGSPRDGSLLALVEDIERILSKGNAATLEEIVARDRRRHEFRRRQIIARVGVAAMIALVVVGAWFGWSEYQRRNEQRVAAENLAEHSIDVRNKALLLTPEEKTRIWWAVLDENPEHFDNITLSTLLAVEGWRRAQTPKTETALRSVLAQLPISDQLLELDFDNMPIALAFNHSGTLLAAGGGSQGTLVWDLQKNAVVAQIAHGGTGGAENWTDKRGKFYRNRAARQVLAFNPTREQLATAGPDNTARIWEATSGRELATLQHDSLATAVAYNSTGELLASSAESGTISVWDAQSGKRSRSMSHGAAVYAIEFSPHATYLASVAVDKTVIVWRVADGKEMQRFTHDHKVEGARFSPDESIVATFGSDIETRLYSMATGKEIKRLPAGDGDAGVIFDREGQHIVIGGADGKIVWRDLKDDSVFQLSNADQYILVMRASTDRKVFAAISSDEEVRAWDLNTKELLKRMPYSRWLMGMAVSPDGQHLAATGENDDRRVIEIMNLHPADPAAAACKQLSRNLTPEEWQQYFATDEYRKTCPDISEREDEQ